MCRLKNLLVRVLIVLAFTSSISFAGEVKTFVPTKPWQVTINLNGFEPWDLLGAKTILGGSTKDGITITILIEKTKPRTKATEIRKLYGYRYALSFGWKETIEEIDVNDVAIIIYRWKRIADRWGYHGYVVKDDVAFDIHLSANMTKHTKKQMLDIIKSFQIKPSTEIEELQKLYYEFYKELDKLLQQNIQVEEKLKPVLDFIKKYPTNPETQFFMGEYHLKASVL